VGIDIENNFDPVASQFATLRTGDALALEFSDTYFDFIYSYHALEHINNPIRALQEMFRVLKVGGGFWIGTPNRLRLIGYLGSKTATAKQKIRWNLTDWKAKLSGQFRNEMGAHAGFSSLELNNLLRRVFPETWEVTDLYYLEIYQRHKVLLNFLKAVKVTGWVYPSVYFMGRK
jgi:ubiquinone/menaquinone biosynthesis C-methylase UbiE